MLEWLLGNIGTIAVCLLLAVVVFLIIIKMIKNKKQGKSSCGCGCQNCSMSEFCHKEKSE